jgi:hypothetical protein
MAPASLDQRPYHGGKDSSAKIAPACDGDRSLAASDAITAASGRSGLAPQ